METYLALKRAKEMVLQFLAHNRSSLILKTTTNAGNWCWSLSFSGDDEDDDEGVMCLRNGCSSLCVFLLFLCFPVGCCFG